MDRIRVEKGIKYHIDDHESGAGEADTALDAIRDLLGKLQCAETERDEATAELEKANARIVELENEQTT